VEVDEIKKIVEQHEAWMKDENNGKCADFSNQTFVWQILLVLNVQILFLHCWCDLIWNHLTFLTQCFIRRI